MYTRVNYPDFMALDDNGAFAVGYEVHTYKAGTSTALTTYSERTLTTPNSNPVILDARGEATIYVGEAAKLILTIPDGDTADPIKTFDYVGEQQETSVKGEATAGTTNNNYVVDTVPAVSALSNNLELIMTPDADNIDTIESTVFTGTGINDLTASGVYIGATSGSVFTFVIDGMVESAPSLPTAALSATAGSVTTGDHIVVITYVTAQGETTAGAVSATVTADGSHKIDLSAIPTGTSQVTARNIYMTEAGGSDYYLVDTIAGNTTTTYAIDIADAALAANDPIPTSNTTGGTGGSDTFKWKKDGGSWTTGVSITGVAQAILESLYITFAVAVGHTLDDIWAVTVITPARVNLDSLGNLIVYKNKGGSILGLDGGDMKAGYPAQLILNEAMNAWLLINPATPTFSTTTISATRFRKNISADYVMLTTDEGYELSCNCSLKITLLTCPEFSGKFFYTKNVGTGVVVLDAGTYVIKGTGNSTYGVAPNEAVQVETNGVDWHILSDVSRSTPPLPPSLTWVSTSVVKVAASAECPATVAMAGFPSVTQPGLFVGCPVPGDSRQNVADANHAFWGTEKASQWYAVYALAATEVTFTVKSIPWMRVKSQATQTISLGTLTTPGTGIGYGFTTDELEGYSIYFISGDSKGLIRTITANNNDDSTGGTITYSGDALTVAAGDWFIILPATNFRYLGDIYNDGSSNIRKFNQIGDKFYVNPETSVTINAASNFSLAMCSPMAQEIFGTFDATGLSPGPGTLREQYVYASDASGNCRVPIAYTWGNGTDSSGVYWETFGISCLPTGNLCVFTFVASDVCSGGTSICCGYRILGL